MDTRASHLPEAASATAALSPINAGPGSHLAGATRAMEVTFRFASPRLPTVGTRVRKLKFQYGAIAAFFQRFLFASRAKRIHLAADIG
jgi:hypothetical protein